jgi:SNF2 family DNA or RNA helicase
VNQKVKKLQEFKEDNVKIMLLSLVKSASGLNLIEANHIVLLDPMSGSVEESRAYEIQALGRAHRQGQDQKVKLMRFVMRDTFEEELYNRNKSSGRGKKKENSNLNALLVLTLCCSGRRRPERLVKTKFKCHSNVEQIV